MNAEKTPKLIRPSGAASSEQAAPDPQGTLHSTESRYRAVLDAIDEGFCVIEMIFDEARRPVDYRFIEANPAFERLTGFHAACGKRMREIVPALEQHWFDIYGQVALTGESARVENYAAAVQGGRWYNVFAFRVDDPAERHVAVLFADVTERHENEARLSQAAAALQDADRRKDEFLATLAHELRNPLAPIRNGVHMLRLIAAGNHTLQRTTEMMDRQVNHLVRLVDDLLDVSRITRGKIELRREKVILNEVLGTALESCETLFEPRGHELRVQISSEPLAVQGDADRLTQVFSNLLSNAAKFTPRGGTVWLSLEREKDEAVVRVSDTGIGIPKDHIGTVFEMFAQVHAPHSNEGLGIGLSLVQQLIRMHGGTVTAESEGVGRGSRFTVRLPLQDRGEQGGVSDRAFGGTAHGTGARSHRGGLTILVVDDNVDAAESLAQLLELQGHYVRTCTSGSEAVEFARRYTPDVIFMDIGMPDMDGITAARFIRAQPGGSSIRIVAVTGWGQKGDRERTSEAGIDAHLVKPVSAEALAGLLEVVP